MIMFMRLQKLLLMFVQRLILMIWDISLVMLPNLKMLFRLEKPAVITHNVTATAEEGVVITPAGEIKV